MRGISAGEFLHECMRSSYVKEQLTAEHTDYVRKFCGMTNNLNQLAHKANAVAFVTVRMECRILVARIEELSILSSYDSQNHQGKQLQRYGELHS